MKKQKESRRRLNRVLDEISGRKPARRGLVLTRREGEGIQIGEGITVLVDEIRAGGQVRLRIVAPGEVRVVRLEIKGGV